MAPPGAALLGPPQAIVDTEMADRKPAAKKPTPTKPKRAPRGYSSDSSSSSASSADDYSDSDADEPHRKAAAPAAHAPGRALAYASSGDPCVDFFFQAALLGVAWAADARTALRLVCHHPRTLWMHSNHPRTLAANLGRELRQVRLPPSRTSPRSSTASSTRRRRPSTLRL